MSHLSAEQIARYARDAGFRGHDLTTAVAIALAESAGDPRAHNDVPPDDSYGLWQINMIGALGPDRRHHLHLDSDRELFDPRTNAEAAYDISGRGASFTPWTTYTGGAYRDHLDEARQGVRALRRHHGHPAHGGGRDRGGFLVDPDALRGYARGARTIADELGALRGEQLHTVRSVAGDSFGRIGKETGFAGALDSFGASLQRQVRGVAHNAAALAGSVSRTARHYRRQDADLADDLLQLLRDK